MAWERSVEAAVGKGDGREEPPVETAAGLARLARALSEVEARRPDLGEPLEAARRSLARLEKAGRPAGDVEASLARLDKKLANDIRDALPAEERETIDARVRALLQKARVPPDDAAAEKTARALARRAVRETLSLPRLTLL